MERGANKAGIRISGLLNLFRVNKRTKRRFDLRTFYVFYSMPRLIGSLIRVCAIINAQLYNKAFLVLSGLYIEKRDSISQAAAVPIAHSNFIKHQKDRVAHSLETAPRTFCFFLLYLLPRPLLNLLPTLRLVAPPNNNPSNLHLSFCRRYATQPTMLFRAFTYYFVWEASSELVFFSSGCVYVSLHNRGRLWVKVAVKVNPICARAARFFLFGRNLATITVKEEEVGE